jgi:cell division protein FtsQ
MNAVPKLRHRIAWAMAGVTVAVAIGGGAWYGLKAVLAQPLKRVVFAGDTDRLPHAALDALSRAAQAPGPEGVTLAALRDAARRVPWVREATVRRRFPDAVEITFEAHEALARWNDNGLVSKRGEVFVAQDAGELPRFRGPDGAAASMASEYPGMVAVLAPLASPIAELRVSPRGAWQVVLSSGLTLVLGRGDVKARAQRFANAWPQLAAGAADIKYADLRYPNGFALHTILAPATSLSQGRGRTGPERNPK